jgi:hypothetical protein
MQPDSSPTFVSLENKRVWAGKRRELARREEVLLNIALQAGVPPLPQSALTPIIRVYTDCAGVGGMFAGAFVLSLAIVWFVSAADDLLRYAGDLPLMGFAFILSLLLLTSISYSRRFRDLIVYPPCVIQLYRQLIASGEITVCEVHDVETLDDSNCLIRYQFTLPQKGESVKGQYVTDRLFQVGTKMIVLYLDATCHVVL